jgi:hypothetical protein
VLLRAGAVIIETDVSLEDVAVTFEFTFTVVSAETTL